MGEWQHPGMIARVLAALVLVPDGSGLVKLAAAADGGALGLWDAAHTPGMMLARHRPQLPVERQIVFGLQLATFLEGPVVGLDLLEFDLLRHSVRKRQRLRPCVRLRQCRRFGYRHKNLEI